MSLNAESVYPQYDQFVTELHEALDTAQVGVSYRVTRLSLPEFRAVWERWSLIPGRCETWAERFARGYHADATRVRNSLNAALAETEEERFAA